MGRPRGPDRPCRLVRLTPPGRPGAAARFPTGLPAPADRGAPDGAGAQRVDEPGIARATGGGPVVRAVVRAVDDQRAGELPPAAAGGGDGARGVPQTTARARISTVCGDDPVQL